MYLERCTILAGKVGQEMKCFNKGLYSTSVNNSIRLNDHICIQSFQAAGHAGSAAELATSTRQAGLRDQAR